MIPEISVLVLFVISIKHWYYKFHIEFRSGLHFDGVLQKPNREGMQLVAKWAEEGNLKPIVGKMLKLKDIQGLREVCTQIGSKKGAIGKVVVEID
jgi:NADPH:quinone reductase-like Zn-dependent oxidoreductase